MNTRLDGQEAGYSWAAKTDEHDILDGVFESPWFERKDTGTRYHVTVTYKRYSLEVVRTTQPIRRRKPMLVESVSLADRSGDSLLQPKDWGAARADFYTADGVKTVKSPLDWKHIAPFMPFFLGLHPLVRGCFDQGSFLPLFDWFAEQDTFFARWFTEPGELVL